MSQNPWFRVYGEVVDDKKIRLLAFEDRWHFIALLACKSKGILDEQQSQQMLFRKVAVKLGLQVREVEAMAKRLAEVGLIDEESLQPLAWDQRQFVSDHDPTGPERLRRFREKKKAETEMKRVAQRTCNGRETPSDTDTDTDTDKNPPTPRKRVVCVRPDPGMFDRFWERWPKKVSRGQAERTFAKLQVDETLLQAIIGAIDRAVQSERWRSDGGRFIPHASTWLNAKGWLDEQEVAIEPLRGAVPANIQFRDSVDAFGRKRVAL